jgi:uncharacterized membrane protein YfcA
VSLVLLLRYRRAIRLRHVGPLLLGGTVGVPVGVAVLDAVDGPTGRRVVGALIGAYALAALATERRRRATRPLRGRSALALGTLAGLAGGTLGGAFDTGGPPVIAWANARGLAPDVFKATLQAFFVPATLVQLALFAPRGYLDAATFETALVAAPGMVVGLVAGTWIGERMRPIVFRRLVLVVLLVLGTLLVAS